MGNHSISISITHFSKKYHAPHILYCEKIDGEWKCREELDLDKARHDMWELVKLGGKVHYYSNRFKSSIYTREVSYYVPG